MNGDDKITQPGGPNVTPSTGHIPAFSKQTLTIKYLPGIPKVFEKNFQVNYLQPAAIKASQKGMLSYIIVQFNVLSFLYCIFLDSCQ